MKSKITPKRQSIEEVEGIGSRKQHELPVSDNESVPSSGGEPANDHPGNSPFAQRDTTFRPYAFEASLLVTVLSIVGSVVSLISMFSGTDIGSKVFTALISGLFAWFSIRLFWDYYRSKDESKRTQALELLNFWGFLWIGIGLGGLVLGMGFAFLVPVFKGIGTVTLSYKVGSVVGIIVVGLWIYWAISAILKK